MADDASVSTTMADSELARKNFITNLPLPPDDLVGSVETGMTSTIVYTCTVHKPVPRPILQYNRLCLVYTYTRRF